MPPSPFKRWRCRQASLTGVFGLLWSHTRNSKKPLWFAVMSTDTSILSPTLYLYAEILSVKWTYFLPLASVSLITSILASTTLVWRWLFYNLRTIRPRPYVPPPSWGLGEGRSYGSPQGCDHLAAFIKITKQYWTSFSPMTEEAIFLIKWALKKTKMSIMISHLWSLRAFIQMPS